MEKNKQKDKERIYLVYLESNVDGNYNFSAVPCRTLETAKKVLKQEKELALRESEHWSVWNSIEEMLEEGIEVEDGEDEFYINDPSDDYYEDYCIVEKEIEDR